MRVLVVSQSYAPDREGGAEKIARLTVAGLGRRHQVRVLALGGPDPAPVPGVERLEFRQTPRPGPGGLGREPAWRKSLWHLKNAVGGVTRETLARAVSGFAPDVIHAHNATAFLPQLGAVARDLGVPVVWHAHDYGLICARTTLYRGGKRCARACGSCRVLTARWRRALEGAVSDVIAVSGFVEERLRGAGVLPGAHWHVLHNPVEPAPAARQRGAGPFAFGYLGALTPEKGIADLLDAFARLPEGRARLVVGGRGDPGYEAALRRAGADIAWLGQVDPDRVYGRVDAMAVPSRWDEPFGLVAAETMARGLPLIASRRGGIVGQVAGYAGARLIDPGHQGALAGALAAELALGPRRFAPDAGIPQGAFLHRVEGILADAAFRLSGAA